VLGCGCSSRRRRTRSKRDWSSDVCSSDLIASDEIVGKTELEAFPNGSKHIQSEGFFRSAPTIPGSIKGLDYLNTHYKVWVVSSATQFPLSLHEKHQWLNEHYPFITWKQMIFCGEEKAV